MRKVYAGIGSRKTPPDILHIMVKMGIKLGREGWELRGGGADGADSSFYAGAAIANSPRIIYTAEDATPEAIAHAEQFHPAWNKCSDHARKLLGRNSMIILGEDLLQPVRMVVCWTPDGEIVGGTGQAIRVAEQSAIAVKNLAVPEVLAAVERWLA